LGEKVHNNLENIEIEIDILNVFRSSSEVLDITRQAIKKKIKTIWLQLDIFCPASKEVCSNININLIQNKCTKIEHEKLLNKK